MTIKHVCRIAALVSMSLVAVLSINRIDAKSTLISAKSSATTNSDETTIRNQIASLGKYLSEADEKSLAALWTLDGSFTDADGNKVTGPTALEKRFLAQFQSTGKQVFDLTPDAVRLLANNVAEAEGTVYRKCAEENKPDTRYLMVFLKQGGKWLISTAAETPINANKMSTTGSLSDLSWLIGDWKAERNGGSVNMKAEWASGGNFIRCTYEIKKPNEPTVIDFQIIGLDPISNKIASWQFQSSGGTGHGIWYKAGSRWVADSKGLDRDGTACSSINVIEPTDSNSFVWQSVNRNVNGIGLGDTLPLKVERVIR